MMKTRTAPDWVCMRQPFYYDYYSKVLPSEMIERFKDVEEYFQCPYFVTNKKLTASWLRRVMFLVYEDYLKSRDKRLYNLFITLHELITREHTEDEVDRMVDLLLLNSE